MDPRRASRLDRARCREQARARFSSRRPAAEYEALYRRLLEGRTRVEAGRAFLA